MGREYTLWDLAQYRNRKRGELVREKENNLINEMKDKIHRIGDLSYHLSGKDEKKKRRSQAFTIPLKTWIKTWIK